MRELPVRRVSSFTASAAIHGVLLAVLVLSPFAGRAVEPSRQTGSATARLEVIQFELSAPPGDQVLAEKSTSQTLEGAADVSARLGVAGLEFDLARIASRRNWLFPFVTTDFLFLEGDQSVSRSSGGGLINPFAGRSRTPSRPPLSISDAALQAIVDRAWSRRERWPPFAEIAELVNTYDADEGRVPEVLHTYLNQNLLQPYFDASTRDPRFWAMLSCVADHVEFVDWVRSFTRDHPSSRATTELLFLLDELAQGSRDTLVMMLATNPDSDLLRTRDRNLRAYDLAVSIRRQYGGLLARRDMESVKAINQHYAAVRLRILSRILRTTPNGYRSADARFLAGEILFNRNDLAGAVRFWSAMRPTPTDSYVLAASEILRELRSPTGLSAASINRILGAEYRRWLDFSQERLKRFGYSLDSF